MLLPGDDVAAYESLRDAGSSPAEVYRAAQRDGFDRIQQARMLRYVFDLSLAQVKEIMIVADGRARSLEEHQENLIPEIEAALEQIENEGQE